MIILREHFDDITSYQIDPSEPLDKAHGLCASKATDFRRPRPGRISRIDNIDVKGNECLSAFYPIYYMFNGLLNAYLTDFSHWHDFKSKLFRLFVMVARIQ